MSFPFLSKQWSKSCPWVTEAYSSGSVQDSHLIPFSPPSANAERSTKIGGKCTNIFLHASLYFNFLLGGKLGVRNFYYVWQVNVGNGSDVVLWVVVS